MDNGDTDSGDGWRFRGGGILQLTGRYNYTKFSEVVEMSADEATDYVRTKKGALDSACWYWDENKLNKYADAQDMKTLTKRINGGYIGLEDRIKHYEHAVEVLGGEYHAPSVDMSETVRKGSKGPTVQAIQEELGLTADGDFGPGTERALKEWQRAAGLVADGIAGPATLGKLLG